MFKPVDWLFLTVIMLVLGTTVTAIMNVWFDVAIAGAVLAVACLTERSHAHDQ